MLSTLALLLTGGLRSSRIGPSALSVFFLDFFDFFLAGAVVGDGALAPFVPAEDEEPVAVEDDEVEDEYK